MCVNKSSLLFLFGEPVSKVAGDMLNLCFFSCKNRLVMFINFVLCQISDKGNDTIYTGVVVNAVGLEVIPHNFQNQSKF